MGNEENITKWKNALSSAVIGFVLVMIAFIIVNTVVNYLLLSGNAQTLQVQLTNPFSYLNSAGPCSQK
jgi:hypothetical protein